MTPLTLLTACLDPGKLLEAQGLAPDPWQRRLLLSDQRRILLNCSRGAGKSRTCSALALHTALFRPPSLVLLLSRALRQAQELLRYVKQGWKALRRPVPALKLTETHLELENGSRIISLPGREDTIRGFQGVALLVIDEAARVPDQLYWSVRPMLNVSQGRLVCLSTPFGARGFFWKEWHSEKTHWQRVRVPWTDCPRLTPADIAEERLALGDGWVAQEYECSFLALQGAVYPDFDKVEIESAQVPEGRLVGGIDFGWRNPFAALWGVLDAHDVLWLVGERYQRGVALHRHAAALKDVGRVTWYADPAGRTEIEELRAAGLTVLPGTNDIRPGIAAVSARLQSGRLKVLKDCCPNLLREARLYRYPSGDEGVGETESPIDADNHALAALRYLVSKIDSHFLARLRQRGDKTEARPAPNEHDGWTSLT